MPNFNYSARDQNNKIVKGTVEAANEREAVKLVRDRKLFVTEVGQQKNDTFSFALGKWQRVSFDDVVNFTRQISTMITAGLQLQDALSLLEKQSTNPALSDVISSISREIMEGGNFGNSLSHFPQYF